MALENQENTGQSAWEDGWKLSAQARCQAHPVDPCYSDCGQRKSGLRNAWKLVRHAKAQTPPWANSITICIFT